MVTEYPSMYSVLKQIVMDLNRFAGAIQKQYWCWYLASCVFLLAVQPWHLGNFQSDKTLHNLSDVLPTSRHGHHERSARECWYVKWNSKLDQLLESNDYNDLYLCNSLPSLHVVVLELFFVNTELAHGSMWIGLCNQLLQTPYENRVMHPFFDRPST